MSTPNIFKLTHYHSIGRATMHKFRLALPPHGRSTITNTIRINRSHNLIQTIT